MAACSWRVSRTRSQGDRPGGEAVPRPLRTRQKNLRRGDACVALRYDNETGKGDHRHVREVEEPYVFSDAETLLADFWREVEEWRR
jgi:hypothetical protein